MIKYISKDEFKDATRKGLLFTKNVLPKTLQIGDKIDGATVVRISNNFIQTDEPRIFDCSVNHHNCYLLTCLGCNNFSFSEYRITDFLLGQDDIHNLSSQEASNVLSWYELEIKFCKKNIYNWEFIKQLKNKTSYGWY